VRPAPDPTSDLAPVSPDRAAAGPPARLPHDRPAGSWSRPRVR